ncbi:hypothetical protein [Methylobacterium sp. OT2]|uniref:hypothetical protein n=1 Tax=Methylobacterium sp. OT2 TaxID=2813779 RepID=UPI00197B74AC|nr:hypothetical protein [Methylobacterium sp. OT2]MBN4096045.1 hypothetical protein [Methylobacterium sp. OT2]
MNFEFRTISVPCPTIGRVDELENLRFVRASTTEPKQARDPPIQVHERHDDAATNPQRFDLDLTLVAGCEGIPTHVHPEAEADEATLRL